MPLHQSSSHQALVHETTAHNGPRHPNETAMLAPERRHRLFAHIVHNTPLGQTPDGIRFNDKRGGDPVLDGLCTGR